PNISGASFKNTLKGRIDFIGCIRGKNDDLYLEMLARLEKLDPGLLTDSQKSAVRDRFNRHDFILDNLAIVESNSQECCHQGTGVFLEGFGLVTCAHVVCE